LNTFSLENFRWDVEAQSRRRPHRNFRSEKAASDFLQRRLEPFFVLIPECRVKHIESGNVLRVDYLARARKNTIKTYAGHAARLRFDFFAIEVKSNFYGDHKNYRKHLWQALDYTHCTVIDKRAARVQGKRVQQVYVFPGGHDRDGDAVRACNRLVGQGNVGQIIFEPWFGNITPNPTFYISGARQWCAKNGIALNARGGTKIGSGVERGDDAK
jgi:hypothetical protein